jgi:TonB family protein
MSLKRILLYTFGLCCVNVIVSAQLAVKSYVQIECLERPLRAVLDDIRTQTGVNFVYQDKLIENIKVSTKIKDVPAEEAVRKILSGKDVAYKNFGENSFVLFKGRTTKEKQFSAFVLNEDVQETVTTPSIFHAPVMLTKMKPAYPPTAVKYKMEGNVTVKLFIANDGKVTNAFVSRSSGYPILDSASISYSKKLDFVPAKTNGKPQSIWMSLVLKYCVL